MQVASRCSYWVRRMKYSVCIGYRLFICLYSSFLSSGRWILRSAKVKMWKTCTSVLHAIATNIQYVWRFFSLSVGFHATDSVDNLCENKILFHPIIKKPKSAYVILIYRHKKCLKYEIGGKKLNARTSFGMLRSKEIQTFF